MERRQLVEGGGRLLGGQRLIASGSPWQAAARGAAQRLGLDPRYLRRLRWIHKLAGVRRVGAPVWRHLPYVLADPEPDNYTYELANEAELCAWVAHVSGAPESQVAALFSEPFTDPTLETRLRQATAGRWWWTKPRPPFGKRLAWYALARLRAPELVVETGVHDGLGSLLLLRALERNGRGRLVSFDINPAAGWLVTGAAYEGWELRIESSRDGLREVLARGGLGLFIHDSLHTYEHEHFELSLAAEHLVASGVVLTDNAHATRALADVCAEHGLMYHEFHERPRGHFYPGGAIGAGTRATPA